MLSTIHMTCALQPECLLSQADISTRLASALPGLQTSKKKAFFGSGGVFDSGAVLTSTIPVYSVEAIEGCE
jgi:hypothetical protein